MMAKSVMEMDIGIKYPDSWAELFIAPDETVMYVKLKTVIKVIDDETCCGIVDAERLKRTLNELVPEDLRK